MKGDRKMSSNKIEVSQLEDNKFQVLHDNRMDIMNLDELMFLLSKPAPKEESEKDFQKQLEEFWDSCPAYPRM
jgi:hypothetical protein